MDWKDYIIASSDCREQAKAYIPFATEAFLVTMANKGLYKRAFKDLETTECIELTASGSQIQVSLEDVTVTLQTNVSQSTCTCPSKVACKHLLMAVLAVAEYAQVEGTEGNPADNQKVETESGEVLRSEAEPGVEVSSGTEMKTSAKAETSTEEPWQELKQADIVSLRKQAGKKLFEDTLRLIQEGWTADFIEGDLLEATINTENITLYFPRQNSLQHAICKCGNPGLCKHKLIAILSYISKEGLLKDQPDGQPTVSLITDDTRSLLEAADAFVIQILGKGINTCGENEAEKAIRYSIYMDSCGIGNLANLFRSLSTNIEHKLAKHVGFNQITTFGTLSRLHNTLRLILQHAQDNARLSQLIEGSRSDYYTTPVGTFTGLGAAPWQTRSGYFGVTAYFFYHEKQSICTYTVSLADYYEQTGELATMENLTRQYHKSDHWANGVSLATLSQSHFRLRNFKLNRQNRLSSSAQTQCELTGKTTRDDLHAAPDAAKLFELSPEEEQAYQYFRKRQPDRAVLIPFRQLTNTRFDPVEQKLSFTMKNEEMTGTTATLEYNDFTKDAIQRLERMSKHRDDKELQYMVCLERSGEYVPISMIHDTGVDNFFFI